MIDQTIETIETNLSGSAKFTKKIGNHSDLYYLILSNKLKEL